MAETEKTYFHLLKQQVVCQLRETYPALANDVRHWKGKEIQYFQEDLMRRANGRVSEKWFYNHFKTEQLRLPRIDMLNLLSQYVGAENWEVFKAEHKVESAEHRSLLLKKTYVFWVGVPLYLVLLAMFYYQNSQPYLYQFCFVNAYSQQPINGGLNITVLQNQQSPYYLDPDQEGCVQLSTYEDELRLVVKGPYYQTDTIVRLMDRGMTTEKVILKTNDYAWMIHVFSKSKVTDWEQRRLQLDSMILDEARIYQMYEQGHIGMELYNKQEFIDKLTTPIRSLKNIEILDMLYSGDKIRELRFRQSNVNEDE